MQNLNTGMLKKITSYDTAGSPTGNKNQDYSAGVSLAIDSERAKIYVLDAWHARKSIKTVAGMVWDEYEKYKQVILNRDHRHKLCPVRKEAE